MPYTTTMSSTESARRSWVFRLSLLGLLVLVAKPALAQEIRSSVALEGYVGTAPAGTATKANIRLQAGGKNYDFAVTRSLVLRGRQTSGQILNDLRPRQNTLILLGSPEMLGALDSTPAGQPLRIAGEHRSGSNQLSVTQIGPASPAPAPTAAKP